MKPQSFIGIVATLFCLCHLGNIDKVHANRTCTNVEDSCLKINEAALKDLKIKISDIALNTKTIVTDGTPLASSPTPTVKDRVSFRVDNLWELKVPQGSENGLQVDYIYDSLHNTNVSQSEMPLEKIEKLDISTKPSTESGYIIVTGGGIFTFDLSKIKASGNYLGNLQIKVTPSEVLPKG
jgi:hypothetical protein